MRSGLLRYVYMGEKRESKLMFLAAQMDIKQKIKDNTNIQKDCEDKLRYWRKKLGELEIAYVE